MFVGSFCSWDILSRGGVQLLLVVTFVANFFLKHKKSQPFLLYEEIYAVKYFSSLHQKTEVKEMKML